MPRLSALEKLNRSLTDAFGSKAVTTERGRPVWDRSPWGFQSSGGVDVLATVFRPEESIQFELPSRNHAIAFLVQEMYAVCSPLAQAIQQMAGDASQDSMADVQPYTIIVNESLPQQRQKIFEILDATLRRVKLGLHGEMRIRRGLKTGDAIGQPIFEKNGRWHLTKVKLMPTWEMVYNGKDETWKQVRGQKGMGEVVAEWNVPNFMARTTIEGDDNFLYGVPLLQRVLVDYRMFIMALEDVAVAGRTRAPRRLAHYVGFKNGIAKVDDNALKAYRARNEVEPTTIITDYWLKEGYERVDAVAGDAAGVAALLEIVLFHMKRMKRSIGLDPDQEDMSGRGLESVDAGYARRINTLRMADSQFIHSVGEKALLLEGFDDVDWSTQIPPLGETEATRVKRASEELERGHSSFETYCATVGIKNPEREKEGIQSWFAFRREEGVPLVQGDKEVDNSRMDVVGTENPDKGADPQKGRTRRAEQRREGKKLPSGA